MATGIERRWDFHQPNITSYSARPRHPSNNTFFSSSLTIESPASSFTHNCSSASSSQPTLFDTASSNKTENKKSSHSDDYESGLFLDFPNSEDDGFFNEFLDFEASASGVVQPAPKAKEPSTQAPNISPPNNTLVEGLVSQFPSDLFSSQQPSSIPQMSNPSSTSSLLLPSYQLPSTLDASTSNEWMLSNAKDFWSQTSIISEPWSNSSEFSLPIPTYSSPSTLETWASSPQMFPNAQSPWTQAPSTYQMSSPPDSQLQPFSFGDLAMSPPLMDSFSYPDVDVPTEFPFYSPLPTPPFDMHNLSSSTQFSNLLAAGPYFSRPADMAVILPHQEHSKGPALTRQSNVTAPDSPKSSPPVHGFYSNQMKKGKTTGGKTAGGKTTGGKTTGGKTTGGKMTGGKTTGGKTTGGKTTRTRKIAPSRETQASPLKRGFEKKEQGKGEGEEDGDGTWSLKRQKR